MGSTVFDLIGPIMVGPSSSHTAGAVRLGQFARKVLGDTPKEVKIILHGSFAETGKGHGTPQALAAGLLGMTTDDERIGRAIDIARLEGMLISFEDRYLGDVHPNSVCFELEAPDGTKAVVKGSSIGGGKILVWDINGFKVELAGDYPTLIVLHRDQPGAIALVSSRLAQVGTNIARMGVAREKKGAEALMVVEVDQGVDQETLTAIGQLSNIYRVMFIQPLE